LKQAEIRENEIWANCGAEYKDILKKTVISLQVLGPKIQEFDFIIRTNVSSYFNHPRIEKMLQRYQDLEYFYGGYIEEFKSAEGGTIPFISGAAVFWNPKTTRIISALDPSEYADFPDDVAFSMFMKKNKVQTTFLQRGSICSHSFFTIAPYYRLKSSIHSELAGIRIQNYHKFTVAKGLLQKTKILVRHQKLELSYADRKEIISYLARCWQVSKICIRYRIRK
jgi:hypothetical protein